MIRRKDIMFLIGIMMCFFSNHNVVQCKNLIETKIYPWNHKFRNINWNLKTSCILSGGKYIYGEGIPAKCFILGKGIYQDFTVFLINCLHVISFHSASDLGVLSVYEILKRRDILFNDMIKCFFMQKCEYIYSQYKNWKILYRYLDLDFGYSWLPCNLGLNNKAFDSQKTDVLWRDVKKDNKGIYVDNLNGPDYITNNENGTLDVYQCSICFDSFNLDSKDSKDDIIAHYSYNSKGERNVQQCVFHRECIARYSASKENPESNFDFIVECPMCRRRCQYWRKKKDKENRMFFYVSLLQQLTVEYSDSNKLFSLMPFYRISVILEPILFISSFLLRDVSYGKQYEDNNAAQDINNNDIQNINDNDDVQNINNNFIQENINDNDIQNINNNAVQNPPKLVTRFVWAEVPYIVGNINLALKLECGISYKNYYFFSIYVQPTFCIFKRNISDSIHFVGIPGVIYTSELFQRNFYIKIVLDFFINRRDENFVKTLI